MQVTIKAAALCEHDDDFRTIFILKHIVFHTIDLLLLVANVRFVYLIVTRREFANVYFYKLLALSSVMVSQNG